MPTAYVVEHSMIKPKGKSIVLTATDHLYHGNFMGLDGEEEVHDMTAMRYNRYVE